MGIQLKGKEPRRNEPCPCESGLKYKYCHGDILKRAVCDRVANEKMVQLIIEEKFKKGMICRHGIDTNKHCTACAIGD